jgi:hypothetical protein
MDGAMTKAPGVPKTESAETQKMGRRTRRVAPVPPTAPSPALSPVDAVKKYMMKEGRGRAYIEFNAKLSEIEVRKNPISHATEYVLTGDVDLSTRNPIYFRR